MKAAYLEIPGKIVVRDDAQVPEIKNDQVLIKMEYCGVCGSDVHFYKDGKAGDCVSPPDFILGHEVSGVVVRAGKEVKHLKAGDRVALEPGYTCGKCEFCKTGKYNLCSDVLFFAAPPVQGALQEYVAHPADVCFKLPDNVSTEEGALVEPLAVGLHAVSQGKVTIGDSVVILGSGTIGLVTLLAAKSAGAAKVVVVDLYEKRLEMAKHMGATEVINASKVNVANKIKELFGERGADIVFETAGTMKTIQQTPDMVKRGGTIVLVGIAAQSMVNFNFNTIMMKEITIKSVFRYRNLYPVAIAAIASGSIHIKQIVTHRFSFDDSDLAFSTVVSDAQNMIKAIIKF